MPYVFVNRKVALSMHRDDPLKYLDPQEERAQMDEAAHRRHVIGTAVAATLESLLPQAARTVEKASQGISDAFLFISDNVQKQQDSIQKIIKLLGPVLEQHPDIKKQLEKQVQEARRCAEDIDKACGETIRAMQFQDRNSQIIENAQNMLEIYRQLILNENRTDASKDQKTQDIAETMYSYIRLSDMRNVFVQELKKRDIDISQTQLRSFKKNDDTELF
jgi:hypothetical protein